MRIINNKKYIHNTCMNEDHQFDEWKVAQEIISKFDDHITDLRKYGFSFITGILTAQAILIPNTVPYVVKFSVVVVTVVLILAIVLFEQNIIMMQEGAIQRALILERRLNLELSELISYQFEINHGCFFKYLIYLFFILGSCLFAYSLTFEYPLDQLYLYVRWIIALFLLSSIVLFSILHFYTYKPRSDNEDWTLDKVICQKGDKIGITLTNLSKLEDKGKNMEFEPCILAEIRKEDCEKISELTKVCEFKHYNQIGPGNNYTWLLDTSNMEEGIYQIRPIHRTNPLQRKIRIKNELE